MFQQQSIYLRVARTLAVTQMALARKTLLRTPQGAIRACLVCAR